MGKSLKGLPQNLWVNEWEEVVAAPPRFWEAWQNKSRWRERNGPPRSDLAGRRGPASALVRLSLGGVLLSRARLRFTERRAV